MHDLVPFLNAMGISSLERLVFLLVVGIFLGHEEVQVLQVLAASFSSSKSFHTVELNHSHELVEFLKQDE